MSKKSVDEVSQNDDQASLMNKTNEVESSEEASLLNSIVEAVMRGDMNQVVTLALSHRSSDQKVKSMVDQALSSAISNKASIVVKDDESLSDESNTFSQNVNKSVEDVSIETIDEPSPSAIKQNCAESPVTSQNVIYSQRRQTKSKESTTVPCTYYYSNEPIISSNCTNVDSNSNAALYCQSGYAQHNPDLDNQPDDSLNGSLSQYQITNSSLQNVETINTLNMSQQSLQVQLPGIGNFLLQVPSNFKPGDPITLPLNLPLTPVSQTSGVNPISINMNTGQIMSNQLLSLYNPSSNLNITAGKKMRAIAPKPSKPTYRQPLIAPKTNSPNAAAVNQDGLNINSTPLPAPSGTGRRKNNKGKKSGRKRGANTKSHKNSSYASSTHSLDSQDASQFNETASTLKQTNNNAMSTRSTYQCNYYVNNDSSDYLNQSHVTISQSFNEINSNTLLDNSDSGEKDLLSLAWEISNAELGNPDDFTAAYNIYDANNLGADGFVSSEILDQFLQNIQKDDIELSRCSSAQINIDSRVSHASSFTTLPPCSTVLPSVTTSTYLNNYSTNSSNIEIPQCIEIAEVVNLNTEDMLSELEKEENALLDKFVAQYGTSHPNELIRCDSQTVIPVSIQSVSDCTENKQVDVSTNKEIESNCRINISHEDSDKDLDLNLKESNELSEIAKQIEISCSTSHQNLDCSLKSKLYNLCDMENQEKIDMTEANFINSSSNSINFCAIPNAAIDLIYSSNTEASLMDDKNHCLMSINFDSKRSNESAFYVSDSSLKSKTLDDFGLFEFCTDGEIALNLKSLNQETNNSIVDDDNKYIEPPILEDISDATPIQSENESEDDDIDELAFKFSKLNNNVVEMTNRCSIESQKLYYNEAVKDLSYYDYNKSTDIFAKRSNSWYIGTTDVDKIDIFSLQGNLANDDRHNMDSQNMICHIAKDSDISNESAKEYMSCENINENATVTEKINKIAIENNMESDYFNCHENSASHDVCIEDNTSHLELVCESENRNKDHVPPNKLHAETRFRGIKKFTPRRHQRKSEFSEQENLELGKCENKIDNSKDRENHDENYQEHGKKLVLDINNIQDRQRRLRKPPKKLAIYQSINFNERDTSIKNISKVKSSEGTGIIENLKPNTDFKRCTRSKGTISKSFDSFYEALSRHHKISVKSQKRLPRKMVSNGDILKKYSDTSIEKKLHKNDFDVNVNKNDCIISCSNNENSSDSQIHQVISNPIESDKTPDCLSNEIATNEMNHCFNLAKYNFKNSDIIRKYNLRKNTLTTENIDDHGKLVKSSKIVKKQLNNNKCNSNDTEIIPKLDKAGNINVGTEEILKKSKNIIHHSVVHNFIYECNRIDFHIASFKFQGSILEDDGEILDPPLISFKPSSLALVMENKVYMDNSISEPNPKKCYPVRKINRKLRMFSGLEGGMYDKNVKCATIIDMNPNEIPIRFQCCTEFAKATPLCNLEILDPICSSNTPSSNFPITLTQNHYDDLPVSDTDDIESLDAPLVIVEIDDIVQQNLPVKFSNNEQNLDQNTDDHDIKQNKPTSPLNIVENHIEIENIKSDETPKFYSLRPKCRQIHSLKSNVVDNKELTSQKIRRPLFNRACKKLYNNKKTYYEKMYDSTDLINKMKLKTPICAIEKLSHNNLIGRLPISPSLPETDIDSSKTEKINCEKLSNQLIIKDNLMFDYKIIFPNTFDNDMLRKFKVKLCDKMKTSSRLSLYKLVRKSIWRKKLSKMFNNKLKLKGTHISRCLHRYKNDFAKCEENNLVENMSLMEPTIKLNDIANEVEDFDDNESINVENDSPNNQFNSYLDSNNVETFSRNYGSFSLKIKVQKKDPIIQNEISEPSKKHKKNSKKRKKLRHFLSSIIGASDTDFEKFGSSEKVIDDLNRNTGEHNDKKRKNRKRKYAHYNEETISKDYEVQDNMINEPPPNLSPESCINEESQYQKPIKIKLFKSTSEDLTKSDGSSFHSEKVVFSLQKSDLSDRKECTKASKQKILQIIQEMPSKQCRQAANLAKKKIFSTAKEDRRSQNATLTSIWNSKKPNNGANKTTTDILTMYQNYRGKRPRGRPPKLGQSLFTTEKQTSSTGTLKLKIKLSKDFKNCNNDSNSSNGENSGRTSTNDSSILNSAVAGINGPSDALSLESNNFINGITEQLDQTIEYLEAKEAKVYFDPNQVDIERIKNSYYSNKKTNSESFSIESQQRLYENSLSDISNKKSDSISNSRSFSQYRDLDSIEANNYNSILSKEASNSKNSHLIKEDMNISDNCYTNMMSSREPQNLSQSSQSFQFENQLSSLGKSQTDMWQNSKTPSDALASCRNNNNSWFSEHRNMRDTSFQNSSSVLYNSYLSSPVKESKNCISQNQNPPFMVCENENSDSKLVQRSPSKRSTSSEDRKSGSNSFSLNESHNQLSPHYMRGGIGSVPPQLNIHPWSDEPNHNASLNHTAAAWMTYAQQQAAAAAYMDPQMKAYYNLALSQSMLNNPYCGSYGNPAANSENFYSSIHSQYLNSSKDSNEKINITNSGVRNHTDPMGSFMEAAQMSSWEHFYSAAAMVGYHNSSQGAMDDYAGRAGNMLQAHHMLANGYPGSMLGRDHFSLDSNKPPLAHQNQSGATSPIKLTASGSTPVSSSQAYSHVQMPYSHFSGTTVGFF